jgi:uncharacterized protein YfaS (alpha-2-macroglobulin family)
LSVLETNAMKRAAFAVACLAILAIGCPGQKPAVEPGLSPAPAAPEAKGPLVWHLSKSGVGFRISNADEEADKPSQRRVSPTAPLSAADAKRIAARMPAIKSDPDDAKDFALRDKSLPAPRAGKTVTEAFPPPVAPPVANVPPPGPLTVERHRPEGPVDLAPFMTMTFSQPMVPITSVDDLAKNKPPVNLVPEPPGKWSWLGTRTLTFHPDKRFPMATEYAVDVPAGTRAMNGQALSAPVHWTFSTPAVTLKEHWPTGSSEPLEPLVYLAFNQLIDPSQTLKSVELSAGRGPIAVRMATTDEVEANEAVRRLVQASEKDRWIAFRPAAPLPTATSFTVRLKAGAPSAEGPRRTTEDQSFSFRTYGPMRVVESHCGWGACAPLTPLSVRFSNPVALDKFDKKMVSVTPELPGMKVEVQGDYLTVHGRTKGRTHYDVHLAAAVPDVHGQTLGAEEKVGFDVGSAEPALFDVDGDMIVLEPSAKRAYPIYSINEPSLHVRVYAVGPSDWYKYMQYAHEWERPRKIAAPGKLVFDRVVHPKKAPDQLVATPIELAPALAGGFGHALVVVESTRRVRESWMRPGEVRTWVQSTELGLSAFAEDDQLTGWVTKLADGAPLSGVDVEVLGGASGKTDQEGLARVLYGNKSGSLLVARNGKDVAFAPESYYGEARYGKVSRGDQARWFVFDDRGMYKPGEEVHLKGWLRRVDLARGGDVDLIPNLDGQGVTYTVRDARGAEIAKGKTTVGDQGGFDLAFKLPGNANLGRANVELAVSTMGIAWSGASHAFSIEEFRRPEFEVTARSTEGPHFVGEHAIATLSASYYSGGGLPDAPVEWTVTQKTASFTPPNRGDYHFGPDESSFWSWRQKPEKSKTETWSSHTNPQGVHRIRLDFDALEPSYPMSLALTAQVQDVNRQEWAGRTSILVHPSDRYVGLRAVKNFVRAGEPIDLDLVVSDVDGKLVAGRPIAVKAARLDWEQEGTEYVEKEVDVQSCDATSVGEGSVKCSLRTTTGGSWKVWAIVTDDHGRKSQSAMRVYVMGDESPKDRRLDAGRASVVPDKPDYKPGEIADVLVLAPFYPAEGVLTVRRQGIVHLERFSMNAPSTTIKVKLDEALVPNVGIDVQLVGADVRADASGTPDPKLPKRPAYANGSVSLKVLPATRTLDVKAVAKRPTLEPGGATQIDVAVKDPSGRPAAGAEVALVVVDESVLALSGYKTPDPISVFYAPRALGVRDVRIRDHVQLGDPNLDSIRIQAAQDNKTGKGDVLRESRGFAALGGAYPAAPAASAAAPMQAPRAEPEAKPKSAEKKSSLAKDESGALRDADAAVSDATTPIALRANFSALALFAPRVRTDALGRATVPVKLPDNLTRYRVMAVAASGGKMFGADESTITARLPIMVRPSAPRFLNFGDKFELPVIVQNQTDSVLEVGVVMRATNATLEQPSAKRVKIAPNDRAEVRFVASTVRPGTARFQVGVASGGWADASEVSLPVWTPATTEAFATYGEIDEGAIAQPVKMPPNVFTQFGGLEVSTTSTQLQALTDAVLYLVKYPFECNEQIASRVISIAALRDVLQAFKTKDMPTRAELESSMKEDFEKLKRHQHYDGGWGFWQETPWPYLTVHVTHALVRAKEKGYKVDEEMLRRAQSYLRNIESYYPWWYTPETRRAISSYALYVRKRMGDADAAKARGIIREAGGVDKLGIEAVGWLWPTISEDKGSLAELEAIRRHVQNRVTETAGAAHFVSGYKDAEWVMLNSDRRADGVLLEAMIGDQPQSTLIPKVVKGLLDHRKAGRWSNTQENAFVLLALDRYFATYEKVTPDFVARVWLGDRFAGEHTFKGRTTERSEIGVPMRWLASEVKGTQNLVVGKDGPGRLYYRVGMQYAPTDLKLPPADHGFVVSRTYEGADDAADVKRDPDGTWRVKAGAKVRVRVTMVAQSRRYHVALVDPIPAGLEPLNPALAVTGEIPKDPKADANKGAGWYWSRTWYEHQNMRDERVEAFASLLWDGVWDYTYVAKATTPGTFVVPPPKAEEMYAPETFGRGAGDRMIIE